MKNQTETTKPNALLRREEVLRRCGLSSSQMYRMIESGAFPRQVKIGHSAAAWVEAEVESWIAARIAQRDASLAVA